MDIRRVFTQFCQDLGNRQEFLSEDNVRFYWFAAMLNQDGELEHYSLEEPYPEPLQRKELDLKFEAKDEIMCFEIKFHRHPNKSPKNAFTHPQSAGEVFNDIIRLPYWKKDSKKPIKRFLLYVTDEEMHKYLSLSKNPYRQQLMRLYCPDIENLTSRHIDLDFSGPKDATKVPETFKKYALAGFSQKDMPKSISVNLIYAKDLECGSKTIQEGGLCHVRLYEI